MCSLDHALPCPASASLNKQEMSPADDAEKTADNIRVKKHHLRPSAGSAGNVFVVSAANDDMMKHVPLSFRIPVPLSCGCEG